MNEQELRQAIKSVNQYLYSINSNNPYGWHTFCFSVCNNEHDIMEMDCFVKDCLRACYTGKSLVGGLGCVLRNTDNYVVRGIGQNVSMNYLKNTQG